MPRSWMDVREVSAALHVSAREVERMAEQRILPATRIKGRWQFRAGEVWNWIEANLQTLQTRREKDRHPETATGLLISTALVESAVAVDLVAKTKASVIRELVRLAERVDPTLDVAALRAAVMEREAQGSTALEHGVAIPHPARPFYAQGPVLAAARTSQGVVFGERRGGLTDLFFLVCCPEQTGHLLYLGRLCRLLIDRDLRAALRDAADAATFVEALGRTEAALCQAR